LKSSELQSEKDFSKEEQKREKPEKQRPNVKKRKCSLNSGENKIKDFEA
jgi:hypothetical protein